MSVLRKNLARTVILKQLPPSLQVKQLLPHLPSGRIHELSPQPDNSLAIHFLDSRSATHFTQKFQSSPRPDPLKDAAVDYGEPRHVPVQVLAAIGLRNASRVVRVISNNDKDLPSDLEKDVTEFGIENLKVNGRSAVIHFMSIEAAIKALNALRSSETYSGYSVHFGTDRKFPLSPQFPKTQTCLRLTRIRKGITLNELVRRIESGLPDLNHELIRSINYNPKQRKAYINFFDPAIAKIVHHAFNKVDDSNSLLSVSWFRSTSSISPSLYSAINAGVSRTLTVSRLRDVRQLREVLKASAEFGTIISHPYNPSKKTVRIEFADIFSPLKAIERIQAVPSYCR
ncbi:hypothetical protein GYMLUDRAFT_732810 [Collybiopsis luxurians FD-317 M1]|nr:hypothetical protein GYMLUDRAFT_732810 [Collybiopsis luxurians FD-317 M1]